MSADAGVVVERYLGHVPVLDGDLLRLGPVHEPGGTLRRDGVLARPELREGLPGRVCHRVLLVAARISDEDGRVRYRLRGTRRVRWELLHRAGGPRLRCDVDPGVSADARSGRRRRPRVGRYRRPGLRLKLDRSIGPHRVRPAVLIDTSGGAVAPADSHGDQERAHAGGRRDLVPGRLADQIRVARGDPAELGLGGDDAGYRIRLGSHRATDRRRRRRRRRGRSGAATCPDHHGGHGDHDQTEDPRAHAAPTMLHGLQFRGCRPRSTSPTSTP